MANSTVFYASLRLKFSCFSLLLRTALSGLVFAGFGFVLHSKYVGGIWTS